MNFFTYSPQLQKVFEALGLTILHSLWQGLLLMFLLWALLRFICYEKANLRFILAFGTLTLMLLAFTATFYYEWDSLKPISSATQTFSSISPESIALTEFKVSGEPNLWEQAKSKAYTLFYQLAENAHLLAAAWLIGSFMFSLRLSLGLWQVHQLRQKKQPLPEFWKNKTFALQQALHIRRNVEISTHSKLDSPITLGWLKPMILLPASMLMAMPAEQLESILIHELVHIRRHDYLWNLLQSMTEVILFYHPAYWYIASVLEQEREHACDMITLRITGRPQVYAQALLQVASLRTTLSAVGLSARGRTRSGFAERIRRIVAPQQKKKGVQPLPFLLSLCMIGFLLFAFTLKSSLEEQNISLNQENTVSPYDSLRTPDYVDYSRRWYENTNVPLYRELAKYSSNEDNFLVGMSSSSEKDLNPWIYFKEEALYLLDGKVVEEPENILMKDIEKVEVYHDPLPTALQNLRSRPYSTVVRGLSEIPEAEAASPIIPVSGLVQTRKDDRIIPVPGVVVEIQSTGQKTVTDHNGRYVFTSVGKEDTLLFYTPDYRPDRPTPVPIENREHLSIYTHIPGNRKQHQNRAFDKLKQRMSPELLKKDREVIEEKILKPASLDSADNKNSLRIEGRLIDTENGNALVEKVDFFVGKHSVGSIFENDGSQFDLLINKKDDTLFYQFNNFKPQNLDLGQGKRLQVNFDRQNIEENVLSDPAGHKKLYIVDPNLQDKNAPPFQLYNTDEAVKKYGKGVDQYNSVVAINPNFQLKIQPLQKVIIGRVTDAETGQAMPGVNVLISGTTTGTVTDVEGRYQLRLTEGANSLSFSSVGYQNKQIPITDTGKLDAKLLSLDAPAAKPDQDSILFIIDDVVRKDIKSFEELEKIIPMRETKSIAVSKGALPKSVNQHIEVNPYQKVVAIRTSKTFDPNDIESRIQGKVIDEETGEPLEGVEITDIKSKQVLAVSDQNGEYRLTLKQPKEKMFLQYQKDGYIRYVMPACSNCPISPTAPSVLVFPMKPEDKANELNTEDPLKVFPNPGDHEVKVSFTIPEPGTVEFDLLDAEGGYLTSFEHPFSSAGEQEISIPTDRFPPDTYFLRVKLNGKYETRRIILE